MRTDWQQAEYTTAYSLRHRGVRCKNVGHLKRAWDIETRSGLRIDVKFSKLSHRRRWVVNLRRRGEKIHGKPDFFIVVLSGLFGPKGKGPKRNAIFVVLDRRKYPTQTMLVWTVRSLLNKHAREVNNWRRLTTLERRRLKRQGAVTW